MMSVAFTASAAAQQVGETATVARSARVTGEMGCRVRATNDSAVSARDGRLTKRDGTASVRSTDRRQSWRAAVDDGGAVLDTTPRAAHACAVAREKVKRGVASVLGHGGGGWTDTSTLGPGVHRLTPTTCRVGYQHHTALHRLSLYALHHHSAVCCSCGCIHCHTTSPSPTHHQLSPSHWHPLVPSLLLHSSHVRRWSGESKEVGVESNEVDDESQHLRWKRHQRETRSRLLRAAVDGPIRERLASSASALLHATHRHLILVQRYHRTLPETLRFDLSDSLCEGSEWAQEANQLLIGPRPPMAAPHPRGVSDPHTSWALLPTALLSDVCHYLPSMKDLHRLSLVSRRFYALLGDGSADEGATRRLCWSHAPFLGATCRPGSVLLSQDSPYFHLTDRDILLYESQMLCPRLRDDAFAHPSQLPHLRDVRAADFMMSASTRRPGQEGVDEVLGPMVEIAFSNLPRLRHLTLGLHVERRPQTAVTEVDLLLRHLPELRSLDVAQYDWQRLTHLFPATLPPPFICRLLSLTVSPLLFYHLIYESAPLPSLVRVALDLDAPFPHEEDPDPLPPSRSALAVFPALRYLDLPADFPLPLHSLDGGHTGVGWAELLHVRWNMAFPWTRSLPPALTQLTSLHLLVDLHSPSFGGDALEGLSTFHMPNDVIQEAFDSLWQLTQLTLTLRPPRVRLHTDRREDLSALQSDGEARLVASLDCWLQPLCSLRFLFIDAGDGCAHDAPTMIHDFLGCLGQYHRRCWHRRIEHLGLSLPHRELFRAAHCWKAELWPALKECYIGLSPEIEGVEKHRDDEWERAEALVTDTLMKRVIGEKLWVSRAQIMSRRVDAVWMEAQGLHAIVHAGAALR